VLPGRRNGTWDGSAAAAIKGGEFQRLAWAVPALCTGFRKELEANFQNAEEHEPGTSPDPPVT